MSDSANGCLIFGLLLLAVISISVKSGNQKQYIIDYLIDRGAGNIVISYDPFYWNRHRSAYFVEYTDRYGHLVKAHCKVRSRLFSGADIDWDD